jgi:hypothetical protein
VQKFYKIDYISAPFHVPEVKLGMPGQVDVLNPKNVKLSISNKCKKCYKIDYISAPFHVPEVKLGMQVQLDVLNP